MATTAVERFTEAAAFHGLTPDIQEFPQGTRTAADAAAAIGCDVAQIVKSLVFVADREPVLILTSGANRVDTDLVCKALDATDLRKADAEEVREATGYAIGGTPPFGHTRPLRVVCDQDLTTYDEVWAAAGTPSTVFALTPQSLVEVTGAVVARVG